MLNWLFPTKSVLVPPPLTVKKGTLIAGNQFPKLVSGFVRFNYNETFQNVPWNPVKSHWKGRRLYWNRGEIEDFSGSRKEVIVNSIAPHINALWKTIGYFPCFWRSARIVIPYEKPVGLDPLDAWPSQELKLNDYHYTIVFSGEISVHEVCQPVPNKTLFEHQILVNPIPGSRLGRYYKNEDFLVDYEITENGTWSLKW